VLEKFLNSNPNRNGADVNTSCYSLLSTLTLTTVIFKNLNSKVTEEGVSTISTDDSHAWRRSSKLCYCWPSQL